MANMDKHQLKTKKIRKQGGSAVSPLQLQLAAMVLDRIIERNAGRAATGVFWDDDSFDVTEEREFNPEFSDPEEETVPEMDVINHNIFECD
jgi:hypothetical protein